MTARILLSVLFAASATALAEGNTNGSEFQWQTPADKMELTPVFGFENSTLKKKPSGENKTSGTHERLKFEYGISEEYSTGLGLGMTSSETETTGSSTKTKVSGLEDLELFFHGRTMAGALRYGLDVNFGLEKLKIKSNNDRNASTGGLGLTPFIGYEMGLASGCTFGARIEYLIWAGKRKATQEGTTNTDIDVTGPNALMTSVFAEHDFSPVTLGAAFQIANLEKTKTKIGSNPENTDAAAHSYWNLKVYAPWAITPTIWLLPELNYASYTVLDKTSEDSLNSLGFDIGARFQF